MSQFIDRKCPNGVTLIEFLIVVAIFLVMIAILAPFVRVAKERANKVNCATNLRRISMGLHKYAADHNDAFPPTLRELYPDYVEHETTFDCPATKVAGEPKESDYKYIIGLTESSGPKEIIVEDNDNNHRSGKNVLRIDGSVEWINKKR